MTWAAYPLKVVGCVLEICSSYNSSVLQKDKTGTGLKFPTDWIRCSKLKQLHIVCFDRVSVALMNQSQTGMMEVNTYLHDPPRAVKTGAMKVQIFQKTEKLK